MADGVKRVSACSPAGRLCARQGTDDFACRREVFDRLKIVAGLTKACEKRPVSAAAIEQAADRVERIVQERAEKEVQSSVIGEAVMSELQTLDPVAYVRFASVYRSFQDVSEFMNELQALIKNRQGRPPRGGRGAKSSSA